MAVSTANATELTQEQVAKILVQPLAATSVFLAAGAKVFDTAGPLRIPKAGGPVDPDWTGENELITEKDVAFDEIQLLPSTMKSLKVITRYSNELARQSVVNLDQAIKDRLVNGVADKLDAQLLSATGDGISTPKGLFAYDGIQSLPVKSALTLDDLITAWGMALAENVNMSSLRWVMRPRDFVALRKVKDTTNNYILNADPSADAVFRLFGAPVSVSNRIPEGSAGLVDFSQIAVARDLAPSVKILTERYADYDQQAIRVVARYDAAPLNPKAVVAITGITA